MAFETNGTLTTQGLFGRPAQRVPPASHPPPFFFPSLAHGKDGRARRYAAQNACHRRMVAAGADWVAHVDVDEFLVPAPGLPERPLRALLEGHGARRTVPRALSLPCVFYAPCPASPRSAAAVGGASSLLLDEGACAGKAQMHRQKLVAHRSAEYLWVHYVRLAARGAGAIAAVRPLDGFVLAHLRSGYSLASAFAARAVDNRRTTEAEEATFAAEFGPRLMSGERRVPCADAAADAAARPAGGPGERLGRGPRIAACDGDDEGGTPWGWCWCRDDAPARFANATRSVLARVWGGAALDRLREGLGIDAAWPGEGGGVTGLPTRLSGT